MSDLEMFPETNGGITALPEPVPYTGSPVPRRPGWNLIATRTGPKGYHRVRAVAGPGTLICVCGLVGRKIEDSQRLVIECPDCSA